MYFQIQDRDVRRLLMVQGEAVWARIYKLIQKVGRGWITRYSHIYYIYVSWRRAALFHCHLGSHIFSKPWLDDNKPRLMHAANFNRIWADAERPWHLDIRYELENGTVFRCIDYWFWSRPQRNWAALGKQPHIFSMSQMMQIHSI